MASKTEEIISDIQISQYEIEQSLNHLDTTKAYGPDGIPPRLLKEFSREISTSLCSLFNMSLTTGRLPIEWKHANVIRGEHLAWDLSFVFRHFWHFLHLLVYNVIVWLSQLFMCQIKVVKSKTFQFSFAVSESKIFSHPPQMKVPAQNVRISSVKVLSSSKGKTGSVEQVQKNDCDIL